MLTHESCLSSPQHTGWSCPQITESRRRNAATTAVAAWTTEPWRCLHRRRRWQSYKLLASAETLLVGYWTVFAMQIYTVSQKLNVSPFLVCFNFDTRERILIFFGRNTTNKVSNQQTLYYATLNNWCLWTAWQNWKHENCIFHSPY